MAKKTKKKATPRRRWPAPQQQPQAAPPAARNVTIDTVMADLSLIKATISSLL